MLHVHERPLDTLLVGDAHAPITIAANLRKEQLLPELRSCIFHMRQYLTSTGVVELTLLVDKSNTLHYRMRLHPNIRFTFLKRHFM